MLLFICGFLRLDKFATIVKPELGLPCTIGSELCGNHLVVIIQNKKANIYGEKVNVLPIEGA